MDAIVLWCWNVDKSPMIKVPGPRNRPWRPWASCSAMVGQLHELDKGVRLEANTRRTGDGEAAVTLCRRSPPPPPSLASDPVRDIVVLLAGPQSR